MATIADLDVVLGLKGHEKFKRQMLVSTALITGAVVAFDKLIGRGGKLVPVTRAFTNRVGDQGKAIGALRAATNGLVSDYDLMVQANTALTLGSARSVDEFAALAEGAQKLGRALGLDTTFALNSLNTGIARQSKLLLDNLGIIVDVDAANRSYAESLDKTVAQLTDAERKDAFRLATLRQVDEVVAELGADTATAADAWSGLKVEIGNTTDGAAAFLAGSVGLEDFFSRQTKTLGILRYEFSAYNEMVANAEKRADRRRGVNMPDVVSGAAGGGAESVEARMEAFRATRAEAEALRAKMAELVASDIAFAESLREIENAMLPVTVNAINPLTGALVEAGDSTGRFAYQFLPDLILELENAQVPIDVITAALEGMNQELSNSEKFMRGFGGALGALGGLGQMLGFGIPGLSQLLGAKGFLGGIGKLFGGGKAAGGPVNAGTAYLVGEQGPELFMPSNSGSIVPNGGMSINVNMSAARNGAEALRDREWMRALQDGADSLKSNGYSFA